MFVRPEDDALEHGDATLGPSEAGPSGEGGSSDPSAPAARDGPAAAPRLGRYAVLGVLGRGGMGVVHEARDEQVGRTVALKLLHAELGGRHAARLVREARAMARLSHPNVVQVFEVGRQGDRWFIAMERVAGRTLRDWQKERRSWREHVRAYLQAGRGLAAAHAAGIVHRDFKPGNCIVDDRGRVRVLDFGLARQAGDASSDASDASQLSPHAPVERDLTRTGEVLGTLGYMPLEQLQGKRADARSDQWSFCASLYEALYGERPIAADGIGALTLALMRDEVRPAPKGSHVPRRLRRVLLRGLAKDPDARWPSMDALLTALAAIEGARRARWALVAGGGLVVAMGLAIELGRPAEPTIAAPVEAAEPPVRAVEDGHPPSPMALELRERAEEHYAAHAFRALSEHLDRIAPGPSLPDDPTLAAELLLWRGRLSRDEQEGAALLRKAHALAQEVDVPSIEARAAGAMAANTFGAHAEGVNEWMRLAWVATERVPEDRSAAIEVAVAAAHSFAQTWQLTSSRAQAQALLEFADATVGAAEPGDDAFVAWLMMRLAFAWRTIGEHERALHWGLAARSLLGGIAGREHPLWAEVAEEIGRAIHPNPQRQHCEEALVYLDEAAREFAAQGYGEGAARVRVAIGGCLWQLGQLEAALEHARGAAAHWAEEPPLFIEDQQSAHLLAGYLLADLGRPGEARAEYERVLSLVELESDRRVYRTRAKEALARLEAPARERRRVRAR